MELNAVTRVLVARNDLEVFGWRETWPIRSRGLPEREVFTRVGGANGKIYIDLANEHWQALEISPTGWRVLDSKQVPIRFRRAPGMLPLPEPRAWHRGVVRPQGTFRG
jgi:hypothetical protein